MRVTRPQRKTAAVAVRNVSLAAVLNVKGHALRAQSEICDTTRNAEYKQHDKDISYYLSDCAHRAVCFTHTITALKNMLSIFPLKIFMQIYAIETI